jgi:undecaprenyl-diphosphatase
VTLLQALVLGIVQGLTEFLPVSSSGHLFLVRYLLGWPEPGLAFDVSLHVGTLIAVLWYFRREWIELTAAALRLVRQRGAQTPEERRVLFLILATVPAAVGGILLADYAETIFRHPRITALALIALGLILWIVDRIAPRLRGLATMRWRDALAIGLAQACALVPGVSRSGATMTAGRALGFDRQSAAVFSFLMSMPIILAAILKEGPDALQSGEPLAPLVLGIVASMLSGWLAIAVLLRFLSTSSYGVFAVYRVSLGVFVLWTLHVRG